MVLGQGLFRFVLLLSLLFRSRASAKLLPTTEPSSSSAVGLREIVDELNVPEITVLLLQSRFKSIYGEFLSLSNSANNQPSMTFDDREKFLLWVGDSQKLGYSTTTLVFGSPKDLIEEIVFRKLDHRLNLFMFFWNCSKVPKDFATPEPLKVAFLTVPRPNVIRVYYNQASGDGEGNLKLVNWYDGNNMGLLRKPLLPSQRDVYKDLQGRKLFIPVIHSPPWIFVNYGNDSQNSSFFSSFPLNESFTVDEGFFSVTGGRDVNLIKLLAAQLNFNYEYVDVEERVQGAATGGSPDNTSFTGGIGVLQRREAHLFLGDVAISLERSQAVEFTFFTLADSGAFVTHIPQRLDEALALIRPFHYTVWPPLLLTVLLSGPILFLLVYLPHRFFPKPPEDPDTQHFSLVYIGELRYGLQERYLCRPQRQTDTQELPGNFFSKCLWFSYHLFLKQNCRFPYEGRNGLRVNLVVAMFWICATYILSDVYSAQLTSQLARPAREAAIDTLHKLEHAMRHDGYELYVEKQSASLSILENGTDIFHRLYKLMLQQNDGNEGHGSAVGGGVVGGNGGSGYSSNASSHLIDSVEKGIEMVRHAGSRKVVLGGRETIYFNMRSYGVKYFQMSEKLYTRYSAVAVLAGSPFLESLNNVLIRLFESGVLDRMTNEEYDKMFQKSKKPSQVLTSATPPGGAPQHTTKDTEAGTGSTSTTTTTTAAEEVVLKKLNLRTLKGAFMVLLMGYGLSLVVFLFERNCKTIRKSVDRVFKGIRRSAKWVYCNVWQIMIRKLFKLVVFKYTWK